MNNRKYERYVPQENNTNDVIQAEDINELQRGIEQLQDASFQQGDETFLARALFTLDHHPDANSMIVDLFENASRIDASRLREMRYEETTSCLLMDGEGLGEAVTKAIPNPTGNPFKKLVLLVDEYRPKNCQILYEISYDNDTFYPIQANQALPTSVSNESNQLYLRIRCIKATGGDSPRIDAFALLYFDETYHIQFLEHGLTIEEDLLSSDTIVE